MAENKQIFRQKSLDRVNSPESLNEYLKVTSAGVWLLLATIIVLLCGAIAWGFFGSIDTSVKAAVVSDGNKTYCMVPEDALDSVVKNQELSIDGKAYKLTPDVLEPTTIKESTNIYIMLAGELTAGDLVYEIPLDENLEQGVYQAEIVTETIKPITFLLN